MWDRAAPYWERQADFVDEQLAEATEALVDAASIGPGDDVLDVAAGPGGAALAALTRVGPDGSVTISDVADGMVAVARRRVGAPGNVRFLVCDQTSLTVADGSFDAVISRHGLMFADDPVAAVREAVRVLRPDGGFAAMTWARRADNPWLGIVLDAVGAQFGMPFPPPGIAGPFALEAPEDLAGVLERGGLRDVVVHVVDTPIPAPSLEAWWERVPQLAGPLGAMLEAMDPETRAAIRDRALAEAAGSARATDGGVSLGGSSLIAAGRR